MGHHAGSSAATYRPMSNLIESFLLCQSRLLCAGWIATCERRARRRSAAQRYNRTHTYRSSDARWMCPTCNAIHTSTGTSPFSGLQFPACCEFSAGHRLFQVHGTEVPK